MTAVRPPGGLRIDRATRSRLRRFRDLPGYTSFLVRFESEPVRVLTLYESLALDAEGAFGTIAEFSVVPAFARTLAFYEREGFAVSGGLKLRCLLEPAR